MIKMSEYDLDLAPLVQCAEHGTVVPKMRGGGAGFVSKACPLCISIIYDTSTKFRRGMEAKLITSDEARDCSAYLTWLEKYALIHDAAEARHG